ncbi:MAG: DUF6458 family protein [Actinomycetota bacterium]
MGIAVSIFFIAIGAILRFAVTTQTNGLNVGAVGVILMIVGGVGLMLSMLFWSSFSPWGSTRREETYIHEDHEHQPHLHA